MPPRRFVFDTNIYRYAAGSLPLGERIKDFRPVSLSAVVLSELWRAAHNLRAREAVSELEYRLRKFVFAPNEQDWVAVGAYLATKLPSDGKRITPELQNAIRKEQNDALIAFSAWREGFVVVTCDDDFERIRTWKKVSKDALILLTAPDLVRKRSH